MAMSPQAGQMSTHVLSIVSHLSLNDRELDLKEREGPDRERD